MSTLAPSRLLDTSGASNLADLIGQNFAILAEEVAKRVPTYEGASPTTTKGPPTTGAHVLAEFWMDALLAHWYCTVAGTPGTWVQVAPALVSSNPAGVPNGYWIIRTDMSFAQFVYNSGTTSWDAISSGGGGGTTLLSGSGAPAGGTGAVGNFYLDQDTGNFHEKTGSSTWTLRSYGALAPESVNDQTGTTYTLTASDNGKLVTLNNASAITVTLPAGLGVGFAVALLQKGAGQVTISPSSTTMRHRSSHTKTAGQYAMVSLVSHVSNDFILSGDTA